VNAGGPRAAVDRSGVGRMTAGRHSSGCYSTTTGCARPRVSPIASASSSWVAVIHSSIAALQAVLDKEPLGYQAARCDGSPNATTPPLPVGPSFFTGCIMIAGGVPI
jgi:hypothetical protein